MGDCLDKERNTCKNEDSSPSRRHLSRKSRDVDHLQPTARLASSEGSASAAPAQRRADIASPPRTGAAAQQSAAAASSRAPVSAGSDSHHFAAIHVIPVPKGLKPITVPKRSEPLHAQQSTSQSAATHPIPVPKGLKPIAVSKGSRSLHAQQIPSPSVAAPRSAAVASSRPVTAASGPEGASCSYRNEAERLRAAQRLAETSSHSAAAQERAKQLGYDIIVPFPPRLWKFDDDRSPSSQMSAESQSR